VTSSRTIGAVLACAGLLTATAACSGSDSDDKASGPVTVNVMTWESPETNKAIDKALAGFKDDNITVKRLDTPSGGYGDKLASLTQAKKLPDLFWCGNDTEQQYTSQGLLVDW
jgi:multiple sugar transport system substrate-binding protein